MLTCHGKMLSPKGIRNLKCTNQPSFLIGTAHVPYCRDCAARYPLKTGGKFGKFVTREEIQVQMS
jgi:hypothetical protein